MGCATNVVSLSNIVEAKKIINEADVIIITAGSGMGADSGLPTFRGNEGFWKAYPKLGNKKISFAQIASQDALYDEPKLAWALYSHMYNIFTQTKPHKGFKKLLKLCQTKKDYFVVTSNIDLHFQKAGFDKDKVYEIHGRINKFQCIECGELWEVPKKTKFKVDPLLMELDEPPHCPSCGCLARPNILLFNDYGFDKEETHQQAKRFNDFMHQYDKGQHTIAIIEIGAGKGIPTIRLMGEFIQKKVKGASLIRINPLDFEGPENTISIRTGALEAITQFC